MTQLDLLEGEKRREEGISRVSGNSALFLRHIRRVAEDYSRINGSVTSDALRKYAYDFLLVPHHPNAWGAVFRGKNWKCIGRVNSAWPPNHARSISVWKWDGK